MEAHPQRRFEVLKVSGLKLFPEAKFPLKGSLAVRFALLAWPLEEKAVEAAMQEAARPERGRELAVLACGYREQIKHAKKPDELLRPAEANRCFSPAGALRRAAPRWRGPRRRKPISRAWRGARRRGRGRRRRDRGQGFRQRNRQARRCRPPGKAIKSLG